MRIVKFDCIEEMEFAAKDGTRVAVGKGPVEGALTLTPFQDPGRCALDDQ
jgi:hypothetical protein